MKSHEILKEKLDKTSLSTADKHMWLGVFDDSSVELQDMFTSFLDEQEYLEEITELMRMKLQQLDDSSKDSEIIDFEKDLLKKANKKDLKSKKK